MTNFWHKVGSVLGPATTAIGALTEVVPSGAAKTAVVGAGIVVTLLSNIFKAFGKQ